MDFDIPPRNMISKTRNVLPSLVDLFVCRLAEIRDEQGPYGDGAMVQRTQMKQNRGTSKFRDRHKRICNSGS